MQILSVKHYGQEDLCYTVGKVKTAEGQPARFLVAEGAPVSGQGENVLESHIPSDVQLAWQQSVRIPKTGKPSSSAMIDEAIKAASARMKESPPAGYRHDFVAH